MVKQMKVANFLVVVSFVMIFGNMIITGLVMRSKKMDYSGRAPINPVLYKTGKIASFGVWVLYLIYACFQQHLSHLPLTFDHHLYELSLIAALLTLMGAVITVITFRNLGLHLRFGLAREENNEFITTGLYRFSRNPMYFAFALIDIAAIVFFPNVLVAALSLVSIVIHHKIVLAEENDLIRQFGGRYVDYCQKVRRYI